MRIITTSKFIFFTIALSISTSKLVAQDLSTNIRQDSKFEQLLNEKRKTNSSIAVNERYKIQIFSGESEKAKKALYDCKQEFPDLDGTIVFNTPNYKVWIGDFRSRIEAEKYLVDIRKKYSNVHLIKPKK